MIANTTTAYTVRCAGCHQQRETRRYYSLHICARCWRNRKVLYEAANRRAR